MNFASGIEKYLTNIKEANEACYGFFYDRLPALEGWKFEFDVLNNGIIHIKATEDSDPTESINVALIFAFNPAATPPLYLSLNDENSDDDEDVVLVKNHIASWLLSKVT